MIKDILKKTGPDIVEIQETIKENFDSVDKSKVVDQYLFARDLDKIIRFEDVISQFLII